MTRVDKDPGQLTPELERKWLRWIASHPDDPALQKAKAYKDELDVWRRRVESYRRHSDIVEASGDLDKIAERHLPADMPQSLKDKINSITVVMLHEDERRKENRMKEQKEGRDLSTPRNLRHEQRPRSLQDEIRERGIPQGWIISGAGPLARRGDVRGHYQEHSSGGPLIWRRPMPPTRHN